VEINLTSGPKIGEYYTITLISFAANAFGILEHINYYHTQLMIDNTSDLSYLLRNRKFKKASLAKDLSENCI
jgi:hypothetical protein